MKCPRRAVHHRQPHKSHRQAAGHINDRVLLGEHGGKADQRRPRPRQHLAQRLALCQLAVAEGHCHAGVDTTMEVEETPEAREATIAWETRQLGIMDWITNDVDWMTKEVHPSSVRLAWHN